VKDFAFINFVRRSPICQVQLMRLGPTSLKPNFASKKTLGIVSAGALQSSAKYAIAELIQLEP